MNLVCEIVRDIIKYTMNYPVLNVGCKKSENLGRMNDLVKTLYEDIYTYWKLNILLTPKPDSEMHNIDNGSHYLKRVSDRKLSKYAVYDSRNRLSLCEDFKNVS